MNIYEARQEQLKEREEAKTAKQVLRFFSVLFVLFGYPAMAMLSLTALYHAHAISWSLNYLQCGLLNFTVLIGLHMAGTFWRT